ncbi:hypothetical protein CRG98_043420 [Punica granatum]|uniref:Chaperone DnaJ C-terminal domain-containing protein n=1 Tax=Punica granatum TaxID=22663 RepID=A0A2I0HWV6_PUNGR|nr:hypothetical protein CRG98_043420 [Punica granatum]
MAEDCAANMYVCCGGKTVEKTLKIDILPGWRKKGTKITFPEKGNHEPGTTPPDLIFVVDEKPHPVFKREKNDLVVVQTVTLLEALTGKTRNLTTLDGRNLDIPWIDIIDIIPEINYGFCIPYNNLLMIRS